MQTRRGLRPPLPPRPEARHGRDGDRLPRRGLGAGPSASRSRCSTSATRRTSSSSSASAARRRAPLSSRTRTSSPSTTAARPTAPTTSRWSTSRARRSRSCSSPAARRRSASPSTTRGRSSPRSSSRTGTASSTATSSRTTSSSAPDGRLKVMDFGIARSASSQVTEAGSIIGTAQYLSPEQARGAAAGPAADLYSTGVVLYEMLTGSVPFAGDTPLEVAMKHISEIPEPPSAKRPGDPRRARRRRPAGAREGSRGALRERTGDGRRPRARRGRALGLTRHRGGGHVGAQGRGGRHGGHACGVRRRRHATRLHAAEEPLLRVRASSPAPPDLAVAARGAPARGGRRRGLLRLYEDRRAAGRREPDLGAVRRGQAPEARRPGDHGRRARRRR